jgi:hypothetical protein
MAEAKASGSLKCPTELPGVVIMERIWPPNRNAVVCRTRCASMDPSRGRAVRAFSSQVDSPDDPDKRDQAKTSRA